MTNLFKQRLKVTASSIDYDALQFSMVVPDLHNLLLSIDYDIYSIPYHMYRYQFGPTVRITG